MGHVTSNAASTLTRCLLWLLALPEYVSLENTGQKKNHIKMITKSSFRTRKSLTVILYQYLKTENELIKSIYNIIHK